MIILNVSKGRLTAKEPYPVNDGLDNEARNYRSLCGNMRPANNGRGTSKLLTKDKG